MKKLYLGTDPEKSAPDLIHYPVIKIIPRKIPSHIWEDFPDFTHVLFTSKNAVAIFLEQFSATSLQTKQLIALGKSTAAQLVKAGLTPSAVAQDESQEGMIELLKNYDLLTAYIFYPRSARARKKLENFLIYQGIQHQICDLYDTVFQKPEPLPDFTQIEEIIFTSPSTVQGFIAAFGSIPSHKKLTCIGPVTAAELQKFIPA